MLTAQKKKNLCNCNNLICNPVKADGNLALANDSWDMFVQL